SCSSRMRSKKMWALAPSSTRALHEACRCRRLVEQTEYGGNDRRNGCQDGKDGGGNGIQHCFKQVRARARQHDDSAANRSEQPRGNEAECRHPQHKEDKSAKDCRDGNASNDAARRRGSGRRLHWRLHGRACVKCPLPRHLCAYSNTTSVAAAARLLI